MQPMNLLIETICAESGIFQRLPLHEERMNRSRKALFGCTDTLSLSDLLHLPDDLSAGKVKCRITYGNTVEKIEYEPYVQKIVSSLTLIDCDTIEYRYKFRDRGQLQKLLALRGEADEILVVRNGFITDTSYSNIAFLQKGQWYTPDTPLLCGTRREEYLRKGILVPRAIRPVDLPFFEEARMINAMISLEESSPIPTGKIRY